jgi:hypothetical protein
MAIISKEILMSECLKMILLRAMNFLSVISLLSVVLILA